MKMSVWWLARQQSGFQQYHSEKHLPEFYPQDGGESQLASKLRHCHLMYKVRAPYYFQPFSWGTIMPRKDHVKSREICMV